MWNNLIERLDSRLMFSAGVSLVPGPVIDGNPTGSNVLIGGSDLNDLIVVASNRGQVIVNLDGHITRYPRSNISTLQINGEGGNDRIICNTDIRVIAEGGWGNDLIIGGSGADALSGGVGNDLIFGRGGDDSINGDTGVNRMSGGAGDDSIYSVNNTDFADGGTGTDALMTTSGQARKRGVERTSQGMLTDGNAGIVSTAPVEISQDYAGNFTAGILLTTPGDTADVSPVALQGRTLSINVTEHPTNAPPPQLGVDSSSGLLIPSRFEIAGSIDNGTVDIPRSTIYVPLGHLPHGIFKLILNRSPTETDTIRFQV